MVGSSGELLPGIEQDLWLHIQRIGGEDQVRLVIGKKIEDGGEHDPVCQALAQDIGCEARQCKQPLGPRIVGQHPAERL